VTAAGTSPPVPRLCRLERWRSFRVGELSILGGRAYSQSRYEKPVYSEGPVAGTERSSAGITNLETSR
jgi:hypothetical protein